MQPVPITTKVKILPMTRCARYNIMWYILSLTCGRSVFFPGTSGSSPNKTDRHDKNWTIVESGVNHNNRNPNPYKI
jgi:hypothetical protein